MLVSFSGIDSAGKTTQLELLDAYCREKGLRVRKIWSKARGTPGVLLLKELLRRDKALDGEGKKAYRRAVFASPRKQRLLFTASMLDLLWYWGVYYRLLRLRYRYVLCDRYLWDTLVELNSDFRALNPERRFLWKCVRAVAPKPKHAFLLLIPPEVSLRRDRAKSPLAAEALEIKQEKIACYLRLRDEGRWNHVLDGLLPPQTLQREIRRTLGV